MDVSAGSSRRLPSSSNTSIRFWSDEGGRQVNPESIIARLESVTGDGANYSDTLPALDLPGTGERYTGESGELACGTDIPRFCADCGHITHVGRTCYRSRCPRCWKGWDRKRATTITAKLEALRAYREAAGKGYQGWKFHHLTLSPPDGFALNSDDPLDRTFDVLKEICAELGAETGVLFYHPYRGQDGDDRGFWKEILPDGDPVDMADLRRHLSHEDEQHFHAVVLSKHVSGGYATKAIEAKTGWVIERITKGEDSDVSIYDRFDLARVVTYCLSHTGIGENRSGYRYFGEVANFTAEPKFERGMDAAVRSVAPNTLGLAYDSLACQTERVSPIGEPDEKVNLAAGCADDGASPEETEIEEVDVEREDCEGRLLDIGKAPRFLEDEAWMDDAPHAADLREAWRQWRSLVDTPE